MGLISFMGLMGCSGKEAVSEPTPEATGTAIGFSAGLPEKTAVTRSTPLEEMLDEGNKTFKVWAYKNNGTDLEPYASYQTVMGGYTVRWTSNTAYTTTTNTHDWEYINGSTQTIKFWDWSAKAYRFVAVAPATAAGVFGLNKNGTPLDLEDDFFRVSLSADASSDAEIAKTPYYSRMWFSDNSTKPYGQPVTLEFIKPFAMVRFMFKYANPDADVLPLLENPRYCPSDPAASIPQSGTFVVTFPIGGAETEESWATSGIVKKLPAFSVPYTEDEYFTQEEIDAAGVGDPAYGKTTSDKKTVGSYHWYTTLPVISQGSYTLTVRVDGEERTAVVPAQFMTWQPGYSYTYIFKVSEEGGIELDSVGAGYTDWEGNIEKDHTVYNW